MDANRRIGVLQSFAVRPAPCFRVLTNPVLATKLAKIKKSVPSDGTHAQWPGLVLRKIWGSMAAPLNPALI
jgi:hypothetical protein